MNRVNDEQPQAAQPQVVNRWKRVQPLVVNQDYSAGLRYYEERNYEGAREEYERAVKQGSHSQSLNNLGYLYVNGLGVKQNFETARRYFEEAAKQNNSDAFYNLSYLYQHGVGVIKDDAKANIYYDRSLELGPYEDIQRIWAVRPEVVEKPPLIDTWQQEPQQQPPEDNFNAKYKQKYLKYKNKYLKLKNYIS
jgi:TPR repeat protein